MKRNLELSREPAVSIMNEGLGAVNTLVSPPSAFIPLICNTMNGIARLQDRLIEVNKGKVKEEGRGVFYV
jgi:hypothetical protein